jgi:hypothetical protein
LIVGIRAWFAGWQRKKKGQTDVESRGTRGQIRPQRTRLK